MAVLEVLDLVLSQQTFFIISCLVFSLILLSYQLRKSLNYKKRLNQLPGPSGYPVVGQLFDVVGHNITDFLPYVTEQWKKYSRYGVWKMTILNQSFVYVCRPEYIQTILTSREEISKSPDYQKVVPWLGIGLLTNPGKDWHSRRKLLNPAFHFRFLNHFLGIINGHAFILTDKLNIEIDKDSFPLFPYLSLCALDIIWESSMGNQMQDLETTTNYLKSVKIVTQLGMIRYQQPWFSNDWIYNLSENGKEIVKHVEALREFTDKVIRERKKNRIEQNQHDTNPTGQTTPMAFLDLLLESADSDGTVPDELIREEIDTLMFAGHDTSAVALTWTLYELGHHPEIQRKLRQEIQNVIGDDPKTRVTVDHLKEMKYLDQVIKESMRIFPPVPQIARLLNQDMKFGDYVVPAGASLYVQIYQIHHDPEVFPNPEKFDPDRFLPEEIKKRHPYAYIPFSTGPRNCIGQKFGFMEVKIMLSHLIRSYSFESIESRLDLELEMAAVLTAKSGVLMKITKIV